MLRNVFTAYILCCYRDLLFTANVHKWLKHWSSNICWDISVIQISQHFKAFCGHKVAIGYKCYYSSFPVVPEKKNGKATTDCSAHYIQTLCWKMWFLTHVNWPDLPPGRFILCHIKVRAHVGWPVWRLIRECTKWQLTYISRCHDYCMISSQCLSIHHDCLQLTVSFVCISDRYKKDFACSHNCGQSPTLSYDL